MYLFLFYEFARSACMSVCVLLACWAHGDQGRVSGSLEQELSVAVNLRVGAWNWPGSILHKPATALSHRAILFSSGASFLTEAVKGQGR